MCYKGVPDAPTYSARRIFAPSYRPVFIDDVREKPFDPHLLAAKGGLRRKPANEYSLAVPIAG